MAKIGMVFGQYDGDSLQRYLNDIAPIKAVSPAEEAELARRIKLGDIEARDKLVQANLRFVISLAREYQNRGVPLADLISAGNIGLITAAERFDETKGFKFISYAVWWIRQAILQTLADQSRVVRLPLNRVDLLRRIFRFSGDKEKQEEHPDQEEIANELGISVDQVQETMAAGQRILSLDAAFGEDAENNLMAILADNQQEQPDVPLARNALEEIVSDVVGTLEEREAEVVRLYFGLGGITPRTLEEIGVKFGLTRERIRQIKEKAIRKLRHPTRGKRLIPHAEEQGINVDPGLKSALFSVGAKQAPRHVYNQNNGGHLDISGTKMYQNPPRR